MRGLHTLIGRYRDAGGSAQGFDNTFTTLSSIDSLKRFQDDAREVLEGFECGLHLANFDDVKVGDVLEAFETREVERTSLEQPPSAS